MVALRQQQQLHQASLLGLGLGLGLVLAITRLPCSALELRESRAQVRLARNSFRALDQRTARAAAQVLVRNAAEACHNALGPLPTTIDADVGELTGTVFFSSDMIISLVLVFVNM